MSHQRQTKRRKLFPVQSRPPPDNAVQALVLPMPSSNPRMPSAPTFPESLTGSSRIFNLPVIDHSQTVNESSIQRPDPNASNLQRSNRHVADVAMLSGIEQVHIGVADFTQNIYNVNNRDDTILRHLAHSLPRSGDAAFNAAINLDNLARRSCTRGTRVDIIAQITAWIIENDPTKAPPVYWLTGLAGLGKTTIVYTICERLNEAHLPFASFFCSLQLDSKNSKLLVPTLCRDLAELYDSYAANLSSVLEKNSKTVNASLGIQIDELLVKPWQACIAQCKDPPTPIIVVDALDESDRGTDFLRELLRVIYSGGLAGIKFLVTSRLDPKIVDLCKSFPPNAVCKLHEVDAANVQNDIEKYLREALPELKDEPELGLLSQRAGGLFIYATTAVRFISPLHTSHSVLEMRSHVQAMLNPVSLASHADGDERSLVDELYERILGVAFQSARVRVTRLQILHTIVCAESRIDTSVLADLTNTDQETVKRVVESLHAVLFVSPKDGCVYWYHASFPDFFFSRPRARINISLHQHRSLEFDVFCDRGAHHSILAGQCLSVMQKSLDFNMCKLPSSFLFDSEVPGLDACIDHTFSATVRYVSRQWGKHLCQAVAAQNEDDDLLGRLKDLLDNKLLFWIEAMNLIGSKSECFSLLKDAETWLEKGTKRPDLLAQLEDAENFSTFFAGSPASKTTPHLYMSALSMWNQESTIWRNWKDRFGFIPSISLSNAGITIPLMTIRLTDSVSCVAFSPDGNRIVSGSIDKSVRVWNSKTGEQLKELHGHTYGVSSVAFSPDGKRIVSGSDDKSVRVWDSKTGEQLKELQGHTDVVRSVALSPDGKRIVSGSDDKSVRVWDSKTGEQLKELQGHTDGVSSVAFSPDGNRIISGSDDRSVRVWDSKTGEQLKELHGHTNWVSSVAFSPDGNRIVSGSYDKSVRVWDSKTGEQSKELQGQTGMVTSVAFSPDGNRIVSGSDDNSVRVWDSKTGEQLKELHGHTDWVSSVAFSPDGKRIVSGSGDKSARVWDAKAGEPLEEMQGHTGSVSSVAFSPDGNRIVSGSYDESVRVWDSKTGEQLKELHGHTSEVSSVAFSPDGNRIVSGSDDNSVRVWDSKTGEQLKELQGHTDWVTSVAFSSDGTRIVSGSGTKSVHVWDSKTGKQLKELQGHTGVVWSVAFSPDGKRIVSGSGDKSVRVWDSKTGEQLKKLHGHTSRVSLVAFSPDGKRIVSAGDKSVRVWDSKTGEQLKKLHGHTSGVSSVAFSPDSNRIVSAGDGSVRVWDSETGEQLKELQGHTDWVSSVAFSPDGNRIVSGSDDKSVRIWDLKTDEQLKGLQGHTDAVSLVVFSPEGNRGSSVQMWGNLNFDAPWVVNEDGWIISGAERLVWVPSTICNVLLGPYNMLAISRDSSSATISFAQCKFGTSWHECYTL